MSEVVLDAQDLLSAWIKIQSKHKQQHASGEPALEFDEIATNPAAYCGALSAEIASGRYRPQELRPAAIPKGNGGERILLIPALRDRIVQGALAERLSAQLDAEFSDASYAYRPNRGLRDAIAAVEACVLDSRWEYVIDADIEHCFDNIDGRAVIEELKRAGAWGGKVAWLVKGLLRAGIRACPKAGFDGPASLIRGIPQGSPLSPLLCNIVLDRLDRTVTALDLPLVRYADDFLVFAPDQGSAVSAMRAIATSLASCGLVLNPQKTRTRSLKEGFDFLGHHFERISAGESSTHERQDERNETPACATAAIPDTGGDASPPESAVNRQEATVPPAQHAEGRMESGESSPLLRTLYLLESSTTLDIQGGQLVVRSKAKEDVRVPVARLHQIMAFGRLNITSGAIGLCLEHAVPIMILSGRGKYFGVVDPLRIQNVRLQRAQFLAMEQADRQLHLARAFVAGKVANSRNILRRWHRNRPIDGAKVLFERLNLAEKDAMRAASIESLRGIEGQAAAAYWQALGGLLDSRLQFRGRKRQPPPDPFNSLLSYGYTVLYYNLLSLVMARGLNPYLGALHATRAGHHALVSDLVEEFRGPVIDTLAYDLLQNGRLKSKDFTMPAAGNEACMMSAEARKLYIHALEEKLNAPMRHAFHGLSMDWRRIMDGQVLALAQYLLGEAGQYRPYVVKP